MYNLEDTFEDTAGNTHTNICVFYILY